MQAKKNPKFQLENYSKIFMQLGLVLSLFVVYVVIEHKSEEKGFAALGSAQMIELPDEIPPITVVKEPEIPKQEPKAPTLSEKVDNDSKLEEDILKPTDIDPDEPVFNINKIEETPEDDEIVEDVPIIAVEEVPIFPGCKGNNKELLSCFNKKMQKHFIKKFDSDLPNELGLPPGKKRVIMLFKIGRTGTIIDIKVKAPHPKLEREATRIIKLLPVMTPGKQKGKPVGVKYTLPMRIDVE